MDIIGDKEFLKLPGSEDQKYELPPLLWSDEPFRKHEILKGTTYIVRSDEMKIESALVAPKIIEMREYDLNLQLAASYKEILQIWRCGDSIFRWIEQCEYTMRLPGHTLGPLVQTNVWPNPDRVRFLELLRDKKVTIPHGVNIEKAVGMRLHYRKLPGPRYFSGSALLYSSKNLADLVYKNWIEQVPKPIKFLPPEQFHFQDYFS